jgi:DNA-binding CsgD family transcriptional regulator
VLSHLRAADIEDRQYRREIYDRYRLRERLSLVDRVRDRWMMLNIYRGHGSDSFRERDIARVRESAPVLLGLAGKHTGLTAATVLRTGRADSIHYLNDLLGRIEPRLTPREREVCARALAGQTVHGIASELAVRPPTVATLRRRAYEKLGISSLNELFARCLAQLANSSSRP